MLINELYTLGIVVLGIVLTLFGIVFLLVHIPDNKEFDNYRQARRAMAVAYLFFAVVNFFELAFRDTDGHINIMVIKMVTISVAFSQAYLFTFACLRLLGAGGGLHKCLGKEPVPVLALVAAVFISFCVFDETAFDIAVYVFMTIYFAALVYYTWSFTTNYRRFCRRMDNYFSTDEAARLRWVAIVFFTALGVGVTAFAAMWFTSTYFAFTFDIFAIWFYSYFGFRLINYLWEFEHIHTAIDIPDIEDVIIQEEEEEEPETALTYIDKTNIKLEQKLEKWLAEKKYTDHSLTIDVLAGELATNKYYLSRYINTLKNKTFRTWINELRIEEAKRLMFSNPNISVNEIVSKSGFVDKSNYFRQFSQQTGQTPKMWLKEQGLLSEK